MAEEELSTDRDWSLAPDAPWEDIERRWWFCVGMFRKQQRSRGLPHTISLHRLNSDIFGNGATSATLELRLHDFLLRLGYEYDKENGIPGYSLTGRPPVRAMTAAANKAALTTLVGPAIRQLRRALRSAEKCPTCGGMKEPQQAAVVLRAAQLVLDRTGFGPKQTIAVEDAEITGWARHLSDEQIATIAGWVEEAKARAIAGPAIDIEAEG